jgi:DnaJ-class molecular chaperone
MDAREKMAAGLGLDTERVRPQVPVVTLPAWVDCPKCDGSGVIGDMRRPPDPQTYEDRPCPDCHGDGIVPVGAA